MFLVGVCHFDDPESASSGWASINGDKSFRVGSYNELQSNVLWVTNITYQAVRKLRLYTIPHIKGDQYFRTAYKFLANEKGLSDNATESAQQISMVFHRLSTYAIEKLGISFDNPGYRFSGLVADALMPRYMKAVLQGPNSIEIKEAIKHSTQVNQAMSCKTPLASTATSFIFPRGSYSNWLLSLDYPGDKPWEEVKDKDIASTLGFEDEIMVKGTKGILDKLLTMGKTHAVLLKVHVISMSKNYSDFQSFGAGSKTPRRWATLPEILYLSRFSKLKIEGGFKTPLRKLPLSDVIDLEKNEISFSKGLLLENICVGLATPLYGKADKSTAVGAYIRAYDRIACGRIAEAFNNQSFTIGSFGVGKITVFLRPNELKEAAKIGIENGVIPPMHMVNTGK